MVKYIDKTIAEVFIFPKISSYFLQMESRKIHYNLPNISKKQNANWTCNLYAVQLEDPKLK
uniref:Uncharacterized protein MANES_09G135900 n=1 Tax=Rhizophora mucronata TaxID=61149 RepID=A0A2P2KD38_RHIMU